MRNIMMLMAVVAAVGALSGCVTDAKLRTQNMQLKQEAEGLKGQVVQRDQEIDKLNQNVTFLKGEVGFFTQKATVLDREKAERQRDSDVLSKGVRQFTDAMRKSLETSIPDAMIYVGGEVCDRDSNEAMSGVLLVDRRNKFTVSTQIVGGRYYAKGPTKAAFCILRLDPVKPGTYKVTAISNECVTDGAGLQSCPFTEPLRAEAGDLVGLYCSSSAGIPYDNKGTGDVVEVSLLTGVKEGDAVKVSNAPAGRDSRAYSFCVIGNPGGQD
jgi:outer membrane murein-binding lipoprotein Lpp